MGAKNILAMFWYIQDSVEPEEMPVSWSGKTDWVRYVWPSLVRSNHEYCPLIPLRFSAPPICHPTHAEEQQRTGSWPLSFDAGDAFTYEHGVHPAWDFMLMGNA